MQLWLKTTDQDIVPLNGRTSEHVWFQCMSCVIRSAKHLNYTFQCLFQWLCFLIFFHLFRRLNDVPRCTSAISCFFIDHALLLGTLTSPTPNPLNVPEHPIKCVASTTKHGQWVLLQGTSPILHPFTAHFKTFGVQQTVGTQTWRPSGRCWVGINPNKKTTASGRYTTKKNS